MERTKAVVELLKEFGNQMREGEIEEVTNRISKKGASPTALRPRDVGIWLFQKESGKVGSMIKEIEFNREDGIEPLEYDDVNERLYNRSALLQNRFEEAVIKRSAS